jgi:PAS domain-containing protein
MESELYGEDEKTARARWERERVQFDLAERAARFGYWRVELSDGATYWSPGMYRLLGIDPAENRPDSDWLLAQMLPEDKMIAQDAIATAVRTAG